MLPLLHLLAELLLFLLALVLAVLQVLRDLGLVAALSGGEQLRPRSVNSPLRPPGFLELAIVHGLVAAVWKVPHGRRHCFGASQFTSRPARKR